jgi:GT2 family glycosyltransferase
VLRPDLPAIRPALSWTIFHDIDALCRRHDPPPAQHLYLRACCLVGLGEVDEARRDLAEAFAVDGTDLNVQAAVLRLAEDPTLLAAAASALVGAPFAGPDLRDRAFAILGRGHSLTLTATRYRGGVRGAVYWAGPERPTLLVDSRPVALAEPRGFAGGGGAWARFAAEGFDDTRALTLVAGLAGAVVRRDLLPVAAEPAPAAAASDHVQVVVPIHGGRDAAVACLDALARQRSRWPLRVTLVDDASPDPVLVDHCRSVAQRQGWTLLGNATNLGYAGSILRGLRGATARRLLLLNADAILPPGAVDRLVAAASAPGVGTVVPFSNDGGFASFPSLAGRNPVATPDEALALDRAAQRQNAGLVLDLPSGTAFCMLVNRDCWDAVGGLDLGYGRGYFEDVDLCLRAGRAGFRNVLAADVYVRHLGGQSFGADKQALVAGNAAVIRERFPAYDGSWAAFLDADPLAPARAAIERAVQVRDSVTLVVARPHRAAAAVAARLAAAQDAGTRGLVLAWHRDGSVALRAAEGALPQNLRFRPDASRDLVDYLAGLDIAAVESLEPEALPAWLRPVLQGLGEVASSRPQSPATQQPDGGGRSAPCGLGPPQPAGPEAPIRIAALAPVPSIPGERLIEAVDAALRRRGGEVVTFGPGARPEGARARTTGPMAPADYPAALRRRSITHLLLPDRLALDLGDTCGLPAAFAASASPAVPRAGDLVLAAAASPAEAARAILAWCRPARPGAVP